VRKAPERQSEFSFDGCVAKNGCHVSMIVDYPDPESSSEVCLWPKPISSSGGAMSPRSSFSARIGIYGTLSVIATSKK
jgi:hypothetical protein